MNLFENIFDQFTGKQAQPQVPIFATPQAPRTTKYTQPIGTPAKRISTGFAAGFEGTVDETKSPVNKFLQGGANLYTGVKNRLLETVKEDKTIFDTEISKKQDQFISDMLAQGKKKEDIFSALDSLKAEGAFDFKPGISESIVGGIGNRMQSMEDTTTRLSQIQDPIARTTAGILPYAGQTVAGALQPVTSALEPFVSPVVKAIVEKTGQTENVQELANQWSEFEKTNPILAENIAGALNVAQLAPVPFAKPIGNAIKTGTVQTGKALARGAEYVAPTVLKTAKVGADVITSPVKSIINTAKKYTGTPEEISGIQSAIKPKQRVKNGVVQRSQDAINKEITLTNSLIRESGVKPTDLTTYKTAIKGEMEKIGSEINRLTGQDLTIDVTPTAHKLKQLANSKEVQLLDPSESSKLLRMADDLEKNGLLKLSDAEAMNQFINDTLKSTTSTASEAYKRGLQILVGDIRDNLDTVISNIPGQFKDIKKAYGALRNVYGDVVAREIVYNRQNMSGLVDSIGAIEGAGNIMSGGMKILTGDIRGGASDIGRGIASNAMGRFIKGKNDPNNIIRTIFEKDGKKSIIPNIPNKPTNGNTPRNITNTPTPVDISTTSKAKGQTLALPSPSGKPQSANVVNVKPILVPKKSTGIIRDPRVQARNDYLELKSLEESLTKGDEAMKSKARTALNRKIEQMKVDFANRKSDRVNQAKYDEAYKAEQKQMERNRIDARYSENIYGDGLTKAFNDLKRLNEKHSKGGVDLIELNSQKSVIRKKFVDYGNDYLYKTNEGSSINKTIEELYDEMISKGGKLSVSLKPRSNVKPKPLSNELKVIKPKKLTK